MMYMVYNVAMKKTLWLLGLVAIITMIYGVMYVVIQQGMRQSANDPQIQLAEDTATSLNNGASTYVFTAAPKVDMANSLAPFVMIFDNNKQLQLTTAQLDNSNPVLPPGVLTNTTATNQNRLTWQPRKGVRVAAVVVKSNNGYVLAGRNLREVEQRESNALDQVMIGWLVTVGFLLAWAWLTPIIHKGRG